MTSASHLEIDRGPEVPTGRSRAQLLYGATAGVGWWSVHLVALASTTPAVCDGSPAWILTAINVACLLGTLSATAVAGRLARPFETDGRSQGFHYVAAVALLFDIAATALVVLESVPVYVLSPCR